MNVALVLFATVAVNVTGALYGCAAGERGVIEVSVIG